MYLNGHCFAAVRPPVTDTANFLNSLLAAHGKNFLAKIFGDKAKDNLTGMGGVEEVAVALSQNPTAESFGVTVGMSPGEVTRMKKVMKAIADGNTDGFQVCAYTFFGTLNNNVMAFYGCVEFVVSFAG
jgi:hypothetical protein